MTTDSAPDTTQTNNTAPIELPAVAAYIFDGEGGGQAVPLENIARIDPHSNALAFAWVHLNRDDPASLEWLKSCGLEPLVLEALTADDTRPRCTTYEDGVILNLRGVNLNPGAEPEDMISVRLWVEEKRVIGVWLRPLRAVRDMFDAIDRHQAPVSAGDLIAKLALRLADRAEPTVASLNEQIDALEEMALDSEAHIERGPLSDIRRTAIVLRRFMFPQRDALSTLEIEDLKWLSERDRSRLREAADRVTRLGEELDTIRDRAQIIHEQIMDKRAESMNQNMLVLSIVAAIFLPLGLLTGLLGVNVAGIPGSENHWAFLIVCGLLVLMALGQIWVFKKIGLLR
ncbi:MAG: zinc transporter ZntB [Alphaproteobacteria bacterium]|nr:zinc transporter ZntB [Alphaproteobacteria bacterium]MCD8566585.1 zinc transporter ZntB [Alphaproteobacteria bacterium]